MPGNGIRKYRVSCTLFTAQVDVNRSGIIVEAAPILKRFVGQHFNALLKWVSKKHLECQEIVGPGN